MNEEYSFRGEDLEKCNEFVRLNEKNLKSAIGMLPPNRVRNLLYLMTLRTSNSENAQRKLDDLREALEAVLR